MRILVSFATIFFLITLTYGQLTPEDAVSGMMRGINIGNTLEPPTEGGWNNGPLQEYYFDDYKREGFSCVRIPVRWDNHTSETAPFEIDDTWMDRIEQVVDWGLDRGFYIIINSHHDDWIKQNYTNDTIRARFDSIWSQIAVRFQDKSDSLLFEIINEPYGMTREQVDDLNARIISIIRQTNPTRIIIFSGSGWSSAEDLLAAAIPDDQYLMGYFHSYDPWSFAGEGAGTWGTPNDRVELKSRFQKVSAWSKTNQIPVMISEFGAINTCDYNCRMLHYAAYVEEALYYGIAYQAWDDGGWFGIYQRDSRKWNDIKDILTNTYLKGPSLLRTQIENDTTITLFWFNRSGDYNDILVERKTAETEFNVIAELSGNSSQFRDTELTPDETYFYRIIAGSAAGNDMFSYPHSVYLPPATGIASHRQKINLNIYPNPAGNELTLSNNMFPGNGELEIYNTLGQRVLRSNLNRQISTVRIDHLPVGAYFLRLKMNGEIVAEKMIFKQYK